MSPGAGLRPSPPPLLRTQAPLPPRVRHPGGPGCGSRLSASRALRGWQASGQSRGGGDRQRRTTGDICPDACHPRSGPDLRGGSCRRRRRGRALGEEGLACECPPAPAYGRHLLLYFAHKPLFPRVSGIQAGQAVALDYPQAVRCVGGRRLDKVEEEATAKGGRRGTFVQTPATRAAAQTFAVAVAVDAGVVERRRERASGRLWHCSRLSASRAAARVAGISTK